MKARPARVRAGIFFDHLRPYHVARVNAAARVCDLVAVQWRARSRTYAWGAGTGERRFEGETLLEEGTESARGYGLFRVLRRKLSAARLDAVAVNGWGDFGSVPAMAWAAGSGIPMVMMSESTEWDGPRPGWKEWLKRRLVGLCSSALVGGRGHVEYLAGLGMKRDRIFQGYDAVDNEYFAEGAARARAGGAEPRRRLGLPWAYFLASARFVEKKNLGRLIEGWARYHRLAEEACGGGVRPWDLVVLGDGPLRGALRAQARRLGVEGRVHFPGFKEYGELPGYYGLAPAFVHASTSEPWGLVVNEAMASGLAVVVSNRCGCAADLVREGVNGFTFDPWDTEALARALLRVWRMSPERLRAMGHEGQRLAGHWGPERFACGLKAALDKAREVGPKRPSALDKLLLRGLMLR